jgi:hypothetical protein
MTEQRQSAFGGGGGSQDWWEELSRGLRRVEDRLWVSVDDHGVKYALHRNTYLGSANWPYNIMQCAHSASLFRSLSGTALSFLSDSDHRTATGNRVGSIACRTA